MIFDILNPFHWIKMILSLILLFILILIPGWTAIFSDKTISEIGEMFSSNFWKTIGDAFSLAMDYYKSWFQSEENQQKIEDTKGKIIDTFKEKSNGSLETTTK
ncbi:MAG TPA: hypothetical protein PLL80_02905 [Candidatus Pacearchaeota archaeon]|nr:hypothetical protein [Candidatus Pacearchaeota archaeon]